MKRILTIGTTLLLMLAIIVSVTACGKTFEVTFDLNYTGATNAPETQSVEKGETATEPTAPTREGYTFKGWSTTKTGTTPFVFTTAITADTTLYAIWQKDADPVCTHDWNEWTVKTAATCTEKGVETRTCKKCEIPAETKDIDALGHDAGPAATCVQAQICKHCPHEFAAATGVHTPGPAANCGREQTCTNCPHKFADKVGTCVPGDAATCAKAQKCSVCDITVFAPAIGHSLAQMQALTSSCSCGTLNAAPASGGAPGTIVSVTGKIHSATDNVFLTVTNTGLSELGVVDTAATRVYVVFLLEDGTTIKCPVFLRPGGTGNFHFLDRNATNYRAASRDALLAATSIGDQVKVRVEFFNTGFVRTSFTAWFDLTIDGDVVDVPHVCDVECGEECAECDEIFFCGECAICVIKAFVCEACMDDMLGDLENFFEVGPSCEIEDCPCLFCVFFAIVDSLCECCYEGDECDCDECECDECPVCAGLICDACLEGEDCDCDECECPVCEFTLIIEALADALRAICGYCGECWFCWLATCDDGECGECWLCEMLAGYDDCDCDVCEDCDCECDHDCDDHDDCDDCGECDECLHLDCGC